MSKVMREGVIITLLTVVLACLVSGQDTRGMIFGRILDPSSAAVAGAKVVIVNTETNVATTVTANDTGYYAANLLLAGAYRLTVEARGFKRSVREGITLPVGTHVEVDIPLQLGGVSETVTVNAEAPLLDTDTASSSTIIDNRRVMDLPYAGGNTMFLTALAPGVQDTDYFLGDYTIRLHSNPVGGSVNGNVGGNEWSVDGTPNNGNLRGPAYMPAPEIVQ